MSSYDAFAPIYDEWAAPMTEDVPRNAFVFDPLLDDRSREFVWVAREPA